MNVNGLQMMREAFKRARVTENEIRWIGNVRGAPTFCTWPELAKQIDRDFAVEDFVNRVEDLMFVVKYYWYEVEIPSDDSFELVGRERPSLVERKPGLKIAEKI